MATRNISIPEIGIIAMTRAMAGAGIGLLIADRFKPEQRRTIGRTLLAVGILTTIPIVADLFCGHESCCKKDDEAHGTTLAENEAAASH
jgi:hypothetical protein